MPVDALVTAGLSALGALVAAWAGTRLGLRKFRQERAFDARLEWHRKLAETAKILQNRTRALKAFQRGGTPPEVALPLVQELRQLAFAFQELAEQAPLFATKRTHSAIRGVLVEMTKGAKHFAEYPKGPNAETAEQAQEMYTTSMSGLDRVYDLLARDLREMLALEELDEHRLLDSDK